MLAPPVTLLSSQRPFPGLRPFAYEDHAYFFGRQTQKFALYRLIDRSRFVAVVGSSGSGKSSLVRAGILPLLDKEKRSGVAVWRRVDMQPGRAPLENLAAALAGLTTDSDEAIATTRRERVAFQLRNTGIEGALAETADLGESKLLILVDQFEELFRFAAPRREPVEGKIARDDAVRFVQLLIEASRYSKKSITVVLTMRSDFIGDCALFQGLPEAVCAAQYLVPALTRDQREAIIREPIAKAAATIEPILVERLLNDSGNDLDLDQLPVLQHCLLRLWQAAGQRASPAGGSDPEAANGDDAAPRALIEIDYKAIGGMRDAMSWHADEVCKGLPGKDAAIERVFRALSELRDNKAIRRAVPFASLLAETGANEQTLRDILDAFRDDGCSFLRPSLSTMGSLSPATSIDVGHEALLRRWEKLTGIADATGEANDPRAIGWLRQERRDARRYESLLSMVEGPKSKDVVLDPGLTTDYADWWRSLRASPAWAARYGDHFQSVDELIERSVRHVDDLARQAEEEARRAEGVARQEAERQRKRQWAVAGSLALAIVAAFAFFLGFREYRSQSNLREAAQVSALQGAHAFVGQIEKSLTTGNLPVKVAKDLLTVSDKLVIDVSKNTSGEDARRLNIELILAEYDAFYILGDMDECLQLATLAENEAKLLLRGGSTNQMPWYEVEFRLGDLAARRGDGHKALDYYRAAQDVAAKVPDNAVYQRKLLVAENKIGETYLMLRAWPEALQSFHAALDISAAYIIKEPGNGDWKRQRAATLAKLGLALAKQAPPDRKAAIASFDEAIAIQLELGKIDPTDSVIQSNLATSYVRKANILADDGKFPLAFPNIQLAIDIHQALLGKDGDNAIWLDYLARDYAYYGDALDKSGDVEGALDYYKKASELREKAIVKNPASKSYAKNLAQIKSRIEELTKKLASDETLPDRRETSPPH